MKRYSFKLRIVKGPSPSPIANSASTLETMRHLLESVLPNEYFKLFLCQTRQDKLNCPVTIQGKHGDTHSLPQVASTIGILFLSSPILQPKYRPRSHEQSCPFFFPLYSISVEWHIFSGQQCALCNGLLTKVTCCGR